MIKKLYLIIFLFLGLGNISKGYTSENFFYNSYNITDKSLDSISKECIDYFNFAQFSDADETCRDGDCYGKYTAAKWGRISTKNRIYIGKNNEMYWLTFKFYPSDYVCLMSNGGNFYNYKNLDTYPPHFLNKRLLNKKFIETKKIKVEIKYDYNLFQQLFYNKKFFTKIEKKDIYNYFITYYKWENNNLIRYKTPLYENKKQALKSNNFKKQLVGFFINPINKNGRRSNINFKNLRKCIAKSFREYCRDTYKSSFNIPYKNYRPPISLYEEKPYHEQFIEEQIKKLFQ